MFKNDIYMSQLNAWGTLRSDKAGVPAGPAVYGNQSLHFATQYQTV